jgi:predicted GTPase
LVRFKARDLCKRLYIDLDLAFLIRLGLGDMLEKSSEKKTANLMLVVGYTGAGKSTTINYLAGVEYMPCFRPKFHLKQKDPNQVAPAQVGHGHNSETLFPNTVKIV